MRAILIASVMMSLLASCAFFPAPTARTPFPTLTPLVLEFVPPGTPEAGASSAAPTAASVIFRDDFNLGLAEGWDWRSSDPGNLSLTEQRGSLRLAASSGYASDTGAASLLLRLAPAGDFQIETRLVFTPVDEPQFAGLILFQSRNAYIQAGRSYCRGGPVCVGDGLYLERFVNARLLNGGLSLPYKEGDTVYLRLERRGSLYTFLASPNNVIWQPIGKRTSDIVPLYVGMFAGQSSEAVLPAYFDYFQVKGVEPENAAK
jgi:beta-xylosidase